MKRDIDSTRIIADICKLIHVKISAYDNKMVRELKAPKLAAVFLLFFLSGWAALVYQVMWMKELSLLFGNSAQAAAATLAAFFTGIAAGNAYWGRRASILTRPLLAYGVLELCVTLSAILYYAVFWVYDGIYPILFKLFQLAPTIFTLAKFMLALMLFFPAAFFMGGTLPVMTQYLVRNRETLGKRASMLYAINTFGAASGAFLAGFYLPHNLGLNTSYSLAMATTLLVGLGAMILGRHSPNKVAAELTREKGNKVKALSNLKTLACLSGFASLALQVLWVRMFAQVLHNSVYTYSAILTVFLIALALGGVVARELARRHMVARGFLPLLLTLSTILVAASPMLFHSLTGGGVYIGGDENFTAYLFEIFWLVSLVIGLPTLVIGILLPYLFKLAESSSTGPGETVGRLVTINTVGAISGSIAAGFILLNWIGLWASIKAIAALYVIAAFWLVIERPPQSKLIKFAPIVATLLLITVLDTSKLPIVSIDPDRNNETLLKVWEGADATVAVVRRNGHLRTKLNNWYTLGGTGDMATQQIQTHLPLLLHPKPKRVFYLGLGTGITAGTSLDYKVDRVLVSEIAPSAIRASEEFFSEHTNGLYDDPRVTIVAEDGRNVLRGSRSTYDLIISDLFIPWKAGTGTLYSVEHYQTAKKRLAKEGMYVQWLPLYQLTKDEFAIIARSMQAVFPNVSIWRGNFSGKRAVIALIGHKKTFHLIYNNPLVVTSRLALQEALSSQGDRVPMIAHYAGMLKPKDPRISDAPLNTDNLPVIEYLAPINHRLEKAGQAEWFVGESMLEFVGPHLNEDALSADPYLSKISRSWNKVIQAGYYLQASYVLKDLGHSDASTARANYHLLIKNAAAELE